MTQPQQKRVILYVVVVGVVLNQNIAFIYKNKLIP